MVHGASEDRGTRERRLTRQGWGGEELMKSFLGQAEVLRWVL